MHARTLQSKSLDLATTARNVLFRLALAVAVTWMPLAASEARASTLTLDFEGLPHLSWINEYYNGGQSSTGETGPALGVSFVNETMRVYARDQSLNLFSGNPSGKNAFTYDPRFANEPSFSRQSGFVGLSFSYSALGEFSVLVYGGFNFLGEWTFSAQHDNGCSDSLLCNWSLATIPFSGTATSVTFRNGGGAIFDDLTFVLPDGETPPVTPVPEPSLWAMWSAGLGLAARGRAGRRERRPVPACGGDDGEGPAATVKMSKAGSVISVELAGPCTRATFVAGVYALLIDETCRFLAIDFDKANWRDDALAFDGLLTDMPTAGR